MNYAAININFDSLSEALGFPSGFHDKTYFEIADRFFSIAEKYNFKYSIYIIGKDLEQVENRQAVRSWANCGHEIGNHSWSHRLNLGALAYDEMYREVKQSHDAIAETIGVYPRGFIAPGWSSSSTLLKILIDLGYEYDTSVFPSWLMYASFVKMLINNIGSRNFSSILGRRDFAAYLLAPRNAYQTGGALLGQDTKSRSLWELPLPANRRRAACWHTLSFVFGWDRFEKLLKQCLDEIDAFYYLVHPADLIEPNDLSPAMNTHWERLNVPLKIKLDYMERAINQWCTLR